MPGEPPLLAFCSCHHRRFVHSLVLAHFLSATSTAPAATAAPAARQLDNLAQVSPFCRDQLKRVEVERSDDVRLDRHLYRACSRDMRRFCLGVDQGALAWGAPRGLGYSGWAAAAVVLGCCRTALQAGACCGACTATAGAVAHSTDSCCRLPRRPGVRAQTRGAWRRACRTTGRSRGSVTAAARRWRSGWSGPLLTMSSTTGCGERGCAVI